MTGDASADEANGVRGLFREVLRRLEEEGLRTMLVVIKSDHRLQMMT